MNHHFLGTTARRFIARLRKIEGFFLARKYRQALQAPSRQKEDYEWRIIDKGISEENFVYRDESWNHVKYMGVMGLADWLGYPNVAVDDNGTSTDRLQFNDGNLTVRSEEQSALRWVILKYHKPLGSVYAVEFTAEIESVFTELQFAINWKSIAERDRFMICNNRFMVFQNVYKSAFLKWLQERPVSLDFGKPVFFRIEVIEDTYSIIINRKTEMSFTLPSLPAADPGFFAFILFEKTPDRKILAKINDFTISLGVKKSSLGR